MSKNWWGEVQDQSTDFYKMKTGDNKIRLLTDLVRVNQLFDGKYPDTKYKGIVDDAYQPTGEESLSVQGWCWGIDRATGELKIFQLGTGILQKLAQLQANEEYAFSDFPMPYDITIHNTGVGPARYSMTPARANTPITDQEKSTLEKKKSIEDIIKAIRSKRDHQESAAPTKSAYPDGPSPDDIPF